jgi:hypothetical protein
MWTTARVVIAIYWKLTSMLSVQSEQENLASLPHHLWVEVWHQSLQEANCASL